MKIYQFIKYTDNAALDNLIVNASENTTFCFDLEDSIQDSINPFNTPRLKSAYRSIFKTILEKFNGHSTRLNIGVRINGTHSDDYLSDIEAISGRHISTIFLPKTSNVLQIPDLVSRLQRSGVSYDEIIPVIETKKGFQNLESILKIKTGKITAIAFGHCDYNFDNDIYPFFHQDAREYWNWVIKMYNIIRPYHLTFVNSPFLKLKDDLSFNNMLSLLHSVCGDHFGQITLTRKQTQLCASFIPDKTKTITETVANPLDLKVPKFYAEDFIEAFEKSEKNNGFAITDDRIILSPHEFQSSLRYLGKRNFPEINFTFVGGCFPVKGNVLFENRFHQVLKKHIENKYELKFNVNIIRYERYMNCLNRITMSEHNNPSNILVFSIRPEPFLRLVKLYYKFADDTNGKIRWSFNLPFLNKINPEKHDVLSVDTRFHPAMLGSKSRLRKMMINLNYMVGIAIGNDKFSILEYLKLVRDVIDLCKKRNIHLLILGPAIRTNTFMEKVLSRKLDVFFRKSLAIPSVQYISGADLERNGEPLFEKNGIYVNEIYHEVIAERLGNSIKMIIDQMKSSAHVMSGAESSEVTIH